MTDPPSEPFFESCYFYYLFVNWRQAEPSAAELAVLHRIDPALRDKTLDEVSSLMKESPWWRLGPFTSDVEADALEAQLRAVGLTVRRKLQ